MMDGPLRYIADDGQREPMCNLAVDEAIARTAGPEPVLRLWRNDRSVIVGRFQLTDAEVDRASAEELGVPVYRRFTGGGAVFHDAGNLNISLVVGRDHPLIAGRLGRRHEALYGPILEPLAAAMRSVGIQAEPSPRGLMVRGRKIGGVAAWVGARSVLVHATVLIDADLVTLRRVLAGPGAPGNRRWELTRSRPAAVTTVALELDRVPATGHRATTGSALHAVVDGAVVNAFATTACGPRADPIQADPLRADELAAAADLFWNRYSTPAWHTNG